MKFTTSNNELKYYAISRGVRLWQVAEKFGVTDATFSRRLRKDFSEDDAEKFKKYVAEIVSESENVGNK